MPVRLTVRRLSSALPILVLLIGPVAQAAQTVQSDQPAGSAAVPAPGSFLDPVRAPAPTPSPRNASYTIRARLDPATRRVTGTEVATWRNIQDAPAGELWFHLYWNAFRNSHSTWLRERRLARGLGDLQEGDWGWIEVDSIRLLGPGGAAGADLTQAARFAAPDDGNREDRTVMVVPLPEAVPSGAAVRVAIAWHAKVPRTFARTGFRGNFYLIAQWFPKLGVFQGARGWNCHQFHANTEFFSDYGVYDVSLTLPERFVVGATGLETGATPASGGAVTHRFVQADVHDFTWTASPDFRVATDRFRAPGLPPVDLRLLYQPEHEGQVARHFAATKACLRDYGTWYGPYPYSHLTIVDPAWESGAGGMEYPTLFTAGTRLLAPPAGGSPEGVTIHECGHQFWYALVGDNEFENGWIDEGLNTFSTARVYQKEYGEEALEEHYLRPPGTSWRGFLPVVFPGIRSSRAVGGDRLNRYRRDATSDVPATPTYLYYPKTHASITYAKTALWLHTLERYVGWGTLQEILSSFFHRYEFAHPTPQGFFDVADRVAQERRGIDLRPFFDQVFRDDVTFDYAIDRAASYRAAPEGMVEEGGELVYKGGGRGDGDAGGEGEDELPATYRSEVVVRRLGQGTFPVDVLLAFEDGSEIREHWDGLARWKLFVHEGPSKLDHAVVDPDAVLLLDLDRTNNSRLAHPAGHLAAAKWASKWMLWAQDLLQTFAFFG